MNETKPKYTRNSYNRLARKQYIKEFCEKCLSKYKLQVHHIDHNWSNNAKSNIQTLCRKCHIAHHQKTGEIWAKNLNKKPCRVCNEPYKDGSSRGDLCNKHRLRLKRHGSFEDMRAAKEQPCTICGKTQILIKGLCNSHYLRLRRHGDPLGGGKPRSKSF